VTTHATNDVVGCLAMCGFMYSTFEELFEIITWVQLGIHSKPIGTCLPTCLSPFFI
jgi:hypothetical protein